MKIYITRHGQVLDWGIGGDAQFPKGDPPLAEFGCRQATQLGLYLKSLGFSGKIYSSPFARALDTAQAIADQTGSLIVPWAPIREIVKTKESTAQLEGMNLEKIRARYRHIDPEADLPFPWWGLIPESPADVTARVREGLDKLNPTEDILLVGHGASVYCACEALQIPRCPGGNNYNCGFSMYDSENKENCVYMSGDHLPYAMRSFNRVWQNEEDAAIVNTYLEQPLQIPEAFSAADGKKVLRIGNTRAAHYPYIQKIIEEAKPDIIVHTGNFADQVNAAIEGMQEEYTQSLSEIAKILAASGAETVYAAVGNRDIPQVLRRLLPFANFQLPELPEDQGQWTLYLLGQKLQHSFVIPESYHWNRI